MNINPATPHRFFANKIARAKTADIHAQLRIEIAPDKQERKRKAQITFHQIGE